jgi:hypothetical protein
MLQLSDEQMQARGVVNDTCSLGFDHVITVTNVHTFKQAFKITESHSAPILFKKFFHDPAARCEEIAQREKHKRISFTSVNLRGFGNLYVSGLTPTDKVNMTINEFFKVTETALPNNMSYYASFVRFLEDRTVYGNTPDDVFSGRTDTNFLANFPDDIVSMSMHAAANTNSFAMQYMGKKMWIFMKPSEILRDCDPIATPPILCLKGSEKDFFADKVMS